MLAAHNAFMTGVGLPPPTITSISPTYVYVSGWVGYTITGTNFVPGATTISWSLSGGNINSVSVNSTGTQVTFSMYAVTTGAAAVSVTTPFGTAASAAVTSANPPPPPPTTPPPTVTGVSPTSVARGSSPVLTIYGTNFTAAGGMVAFQGGGLNNWGLSYTFYSSGAVGVQIPAPTSTGVIYIYPRSSNGDGTWTDVGLTAT